MYRSIFIFLIFLIPFVSYSHRITIDRDSIIDIDSILIESYFTSQPFLTLTSSAKVIEKPSLLTQAPNDYLSAINNIAGVRMEERSPGSYRLAIRGSMIRSPFGIRNIKIYMDDFPLTDAGGNTYLNLFDPNSTHSIHVLKGPDGSIYGPNSGGVIRFNPEGFEKNLQNNISIQLNTGSYGLFNQTVGISHKASDKYQFSVNQSFNRNDGYRENSALNKKTFQTAHQWQYSTRGRIKWFGLYSDLFYQTPGGLTLDQYKNNPSSARPPVGSTPGASDQKAAIFNKTTYTGISNQYNINNHVQHHISIFGTFTDFENPFITNYEYRKEKNFGLRTFITYQPIHSHTIQWKTFIGLESQRGKHDIKNYDNDSGHATDPQAFDLLYNTQSTFFIKNEVLFLEKLSIDASLGWNDQTIKYKQEFPIISELENFNIQDAWMPRLGLSYKLTSNMAWRASLSKGFSPPTIAEIRGSNNVINRELKPEQGTNYETGWRWQSSNRRWITDFAVYKYQMKNGIIKQLDEIGADYYQNAGVIDQKGLEFSIMGYLITPNQYSFINSLTIDANITQQKYTFKRYITGEQNYSGNKVTAVPSGIYSSTLQMKIQKRYHLNLYYIYTSKSPLNDANIFFADSFHLLKAKLNYNYSFQSKYDIDIFVGGDNLLNQKYSLGNDINAFGNRFYNPAPPFNFYAGVKINL